MTYHGLWEQWIWLPQEWLPVPLWIKSSVPLVIQRLVCWLRPKALWQEEPPCSVSVWWLMVCFWGIRKRGKRGGPFNDKDSMEQLSVCICPRVFIKEAHKMASPTATALRATCRAVLTCKPSRESWLQGRTGSGWDFTLQLCSANHAWNSNPERWRLYTLDPYKMQTPWGEGP